MTYFVSSAPLENIQIIPQNDVEEIIQNLHTILSTPKGSVPMYREFGIDASVIDVNVNAAMSLMVNAIYEAIETFEPRAEIVGVTFKDPETQGKLIPVVEVKINAGN